MGSKGVMCGRYNPQHDPVCIAKKNGAEFEILLKNLRRESGLIIRAGIGAIPAGNPVLLISKDPIVL